MDPAAEPYRRECLQLIRQLQRQLEEDTGSFHEAAEGDIADQYRLGADREKKLLKQLEHDIRFR